MANLRFLFDYARYFLRAKTRHGVHSPFVYKLIDEVIYDRAPKTDYALPENIRREMLADPRTIEVTDLGAGSGKNKTKQRRVADIARHALKPPKMAQLLYRLARFHQPENLVELGTCLGTTTVYLRQAAPEARIYTLEGCPNTASVAQKNIGEKGTVELITGNFDDTLPPMIAREQKLDFVFIDGNHRYEPTLRYFSWILPKLHESSLVIFDDIYWSAEMKRAWANIKAHPDVTLTIDLFWIGLVYFRKGREKEHFTVRY
ncbi:MAG: class I SAM-dependent methyltransferase [Mucilaginibacter polytrichastri]|nr:class I SAM-dependent methyltransferase [Mucilaginibacter polytrichastri]